jgi:four helix bundle protein
MADFFRVEDLQVYQKLCHLHIEICELTKSWPPEEKYELGSQVRRSSNSSPANLAEKHSDRHVKNKIEGVNRARGEALETVHHLYMSKLKGYINGNTYQQYRNRYMECIRMLNGMEKTIERHLDAHLHRWPHDENISIDRAEQDTASLNNPEPRTLNPEP